MPQYSITKEEIDFLQSLGSGQSSKDESLYKFTTEHKEQEIKNSKNSSSTT